MRIKISYKLFTAFLLTSTMIIGLILIMQYYASRNFADYVNKTELEKLDELVDGLAQEYQTHNGFDLFKNNPHQWHLILTKFNLTPLPLIHTRPDDNRRKGDRRPPRWRPYLPPVEDPPPPYKNDNRDEAADFYEENNKDKRPPPPHHDWKKEEENTQEREPPPNMPFNIGPRLSLFDAQKNIIIGNPFPGEISFREINVDGKIVGWIGLRKRERLSRDPEADFLKYQYQLFYLTGVCVFILTALISLFLSRHFLKPIRALINGTRSLTSRNFDAKIKTGSSDELGQLANDFNQMAETLKKYEQMRQRWISDISHELRTPLSILKGEIEAIQDGIRKMDQESLDSLHSETIRMSKLVDDLHLLSLADSKNLFLKKEPVNPLHILTQTINIFQTRLNQQEIDVHLDLEEHDHIRISGDTDRLIQLFSNLLENILRYADAPGTLTIWEEYTDNVLTICFEDSGPGVPWESLSHIFDRLYRVDKSRSRVLGGSGLGLSICKEIVESHDGTIRAENAQSGGLKIEIVFPLFVNYEKP